MSECRYGQSFGHWSRTSIPAESQTNVTTSFGMGRSASGTSAWVRASPSGDLVVELHEAGGGRRDVGDVRGLVVDAWLHVPRSVQQEGNVLEVIPWARVREPAVHGVRILREVLHLAAPVAAERVHHPFEPAVFDRVAELGCPGRVPGSGLFALDGRDATARRHRP